MLKPFLELECQDIEIISNKILELIADKFGQTKEDISNIDLELIAELHNLSKPVVFNSRLAYSVIKIDPAITPRVIASFTFKNDPIHLLK